MLNFILFLTLTFLMTFNVVIINDTRKSNDPNIDKYSATTTVFLIELIKLGLCFMFLLVCCELSLRKFLKTLKDEVVIKWLDTLKCSVPALIYVVQNNLIYVALSYLDAGTYVVTVQIRLLTTALFMRILLGKVLKPIQWLSLVILLVGVSFAELDEYSSTTVKITGKATDKSQVASALLAKESTLTGGGDTTQNGHKLSQKSNLGSDSEAVYDDYDYDYDSNPSDVSSKSLVSSSKYTASSLTYKLFNYHIIELDFLKIARQSNLNFFKGLAAAVAMTFTSALAGVYMEKLVKAKDQSSSVNTSMGSSGSRIAAVNKQQKATSEVALLWIRNIQMFLFSIPCALFGCIAKDGAELGQKGFLHGYTVQVWLIVASGSLGGLATALMLKYLDNIYKNFSSSFSIILAALCSMVLYDKVYHELFFIGCSMVVFSLLLYHRNADHISNRPKKSTTTILGAGETPLSKTLQDSMTRISTITNVASRGNWT
ncbi:UDP-N-acetylglucosamine transporter-like isoform X2 [Convolutriloba macropyga]|uniref:UDP-N-acetylglucosamine transporter-like isoform X2 n=1 Tax=Convolutriloba macropyga TaxID=536237 RepID=UPI003F51CFD4